MDPAMTVSLDHTSLSAMATANQYLLGLLVVNGVGLLVLFAMLIGSAQALQKMNRRLDATLSDWEPRLLQMEADWKILQAQLLERLEQSGESMSQMNGLVRRADATLEDLTPKLERIASDAEQLVLQVRHGMADFQQTVMPKLRTVTNVAGALREGFGIFQQLRSNRPPERR